MQWVILLILGVIVALIAWNKLRPPRGITNFSDKVVLITGASSGIGNATARKFAEQGAKLVLVARRGEVLDALKTSLPNPEQNILTITADLTKPEDVERIISHTQSSFGHIDILVSNAGIVDTEPLENIDYTRIQQIIDVNLIAPINLIRLALPLLHKPEKAHIVNVSSTVGLTRVPRQSAYGASKAGLNGFSDAMRRELHGTGIGVSMVLPGLVNTPMLGDFNSRDDALNMLKEVGMDIPGVYLNEPQDVADKIIDAIKYERHEIIMGGWMFGLLSLMGRHTPAWLDGVYVQMFKADDLQETISGKS